MNKLSAEAYAIIEGRHSDPFHYLGLHKEGEKTVVRAFLPEASKVEAVGERGDVASLTRIHDPCRTAPSGTSCVPSSATMSSSSRIPTAFRRS